MPSLILGLILGQMLGLMLNFRLEAAAWKAGADYCKITFCSIGVEASLDHSTMEPS